LYLAVPKEVYQNVFDEPVGQGVLTEYELRLVVFDVAREEIALWMPKP